MPISFAIWSHAIARAKTIPRGCGRSSILKSGNASLLTERASAAETRSRLPNQDQAFSGQRRCALIRQLTEAQGRQFSGRLNKGGRKESGMRILWLKSELLHPVDKGGKIRTYQMLKHINRAHDVTYMTFIGPKDSPESLEQSAEYCQQLSLIPRSETQKNGIQFYSDLALNLSSRLPYAIQKYRSAEMRRAVERELSERNHDVVVCDFLV